MNQDAQSDSETRSGRSIELEVEVPGTPEEVWRAIASGPGISSWYVPHEIEEVEGGAATASFGPGPDMKVDGRVAVWDPPRRVCFDGGEGVDGLAFEWLIEARDGGSCVVRLVNSGFGKGGEWDAHYDAMTEGWKMFLSNLRLHLKHFPGDTASASLPLGRWPLAPATAWVRLCSLLDLSGRPVVGDQASFSISDGETSMEMAGTIVTVAPTSVSMLIDRPARGTAFVAAEPRGDESGGSSEMSMWCYLYDADRHALADRWYQVACAWLAESAPSP